MPWGVLLLEHRPQAADAVALELHRAFVSRVGEYRAGPVVPGFEERWPALVGEASRLKQAELTDRLDWFVHDEALALFLCAPEALSAVNKRVDFRPYRTTFELARTTVAAGHWSRRCSFAPANGRPARDFVSPVCQVWGRGGRSPPPLPYRTGFPRDFSRRRGGQFSGNGSFRYDWRPRRAPEGSGARIGQSRGRRLGREPEGTKGQPIPGRSTRIPCYAASSQSPSSAIAAPTPAPKRTGWPTSFRARSRIASWAASAVGWAWAGPMWPRRNSLPISSP